MGVYTAPVTRADGLANADYAMTLEEIGAIEGITRERVRQIINRALNKLKAQNMPELLTMREMANELRKRGGNTNHGVIR
jgi:DNA-directed RNA polymerase sigma subunit (sigma70/sigma32)